MELGEASSRSTVTKRQAHGCHAARAVRAGNHPATIHGYAVLQPFPGANFVRTDISSDPGIHTSLRSPGRLARGDAKGVWGRERVLMLLVQGQVRWHRDNERKRQPCIVLSLVDKHDEASHGRNRCALRHTTHTSPGK